jgi:hypothetical protein
MTRFGRVVLWDDDEVGDALWMPLIVFLARTREEGVYPPLAWELDFRDFMLMNGVERKPRPFLYVYKHVESRRELAVDKDGSPYRFLPSGKHGQYRTSDFRRAVWQLDPLFIRAVRRRRRGEVGEGIDDDLGDLWEPSHERQPVVARHLHAVH